MYRYLFNLSYIGTPFRGAQRQLKVPDDKTTVQGSMEIALRIVKPVNNIHVTTSSRTDTGVHALHTTMHSDLECSSGKPYSTKGLTFQLNKYFFNRNIPIQIQSTFQVPEDFHCRHAMSRTYLYRLVIINMPANPLACHIPIEGMNRAYYRCSTTFDLDKMKSCAQLFMGHHDFRSFMGRSPLQPDKITRRVITRCDVIETSNKLYSEFSVPDAWVREGEKHLHIDVVIESSGFLYRQVRRMLAALVAAAEGSVTEDQIRRMLTVPSHRSWESRLKTAPASGLYLARVNYPPAAISTFREW